LGIWVFLDKLLDGGVQDAGAPAGPQILRQLKARAGARTHGRQARGRVLQRLAARPDTEAQVAANIAGGAVAGKSSRRDGAS
jgi:hypothetical protein